MKLFYLPGSCALAPHIALEHAGLDYEAVRVERGRQYDPAYLAVNPLGRVPALVTPSHGTVTEVPAVLTYIADAAPDLELLPRRATSEHYQALRWMAYLSSTVHPAFARLWRAERFAGSEACIPSTEQAAAAQLSKDFAYIDDQLGDRRWLVGDKATVVDFYLFVIGRWGLRLQGGTRAFANVYRHTLALAELTATKAAIAQQGITFEGPPSGLG